ncbi:HAD superfamily hydrolase (TIGR01509 family)/HAD superfamily hydrolase (TIGR01549 family) [Branchiibius hedensis]|uniref:Haloacid dehalogenase superfamily, subfamily IA, variant 3 with third motif having DD or ED/haloacid dehalogenase superfamily, subfamily IA, variant 1 with third motif having Dx(3-4)D or Dx(3-4)E n=1 Tax=Branchiibius hedensis TaxID=672460 RepID=A0A2Y9BNU8_9MICO|nr:HAD family phosphatase [Branchiibius hedensis]PWJ23312.1 HAD superfamily hydrolase (TIGR01509 family)/HAD superfamily hydrolase (TIGR01549 family) [Branchiibius hedensis]SSA59001.1 haloacid dehalogenase superfamily, subfamily IA, variant 3 with third motif having DD or ED/haloacid dehalogenase superfamily, subfamily IA, variant 1 with third motif having Dx(3-4)D or Dx(3-4)E [Branchiibius hedensis]
MDQRPSGQGLELIIFDCDGTLVDTETAGVEVDRRVLADFGWELTTVEVSARFRGQSHQYFQDQIEQHVGHSLPEGWEWAYRDWYHAILDDVTSMPGAREVLSTLAETRICVASNGSRSATQEKLDRAGLSSYFAGSVFSAEDVEAGKPAPDLFHYSARKCDARPDRCLVVEDSASGIEAALSAGMFGVGVRHLNPHADRLESYGVPMIDTLFDLPALIATWAP